MIGVVKQQNSKSTATMKQENNTDIVMQSLRTPTGWLRSLNIAVLAFFITTFYAPSALAIKTGIEEQEKRANIEASLPENQSDTAAYTAKLKRMKGHFREAERLFNVQKDSLIGQVTDIDNAIENGGSIFQQDNRWKKELNAGLSLAAQAVKLNDSVDQDFKSVKDWIKSKELPELFMQRHNEAYGKYEARYSEFVSKLKPLQQATQSGDEAQQIAALETLNTYLKDQQFGRKHQEFDGETMGNSAPVSAEGRPLLITKSDYLRAGAQSNPEMQIAALGDFDFSTLPGADDPAFLAETDEVVLSQAVKDQAAELNHDPVKIYHWVRNNIEMIPGWGSYQNADLTLGARRGNSFDVSSLLIALLRASQIPARYVMGVAEIDAERYTNWLGNFDNADIASDYAVQNGIAIEVVTAGGKITKVRTQHMWVQAAIDYYPSRGAKNKSADSWIDLDPSFKQYEYQEGLDVLEITGVDAEGLANQFINSGTVDEDAGFVQNLDPTALLQAQEEAQTKLQEYIENNLSDPTVGDVIGGRRTIIEDYPILASGLPYKKFSEGATYAEIPESLQNKVSIGFNDNRMTFPFAKVNNEKVTLQFTPATQADEDALAALLPEGEITDLSQLPSNISGYLLSVRPELSLNGEVFLTDNNMRLGNEINLTYQISGPLATYAPYNYSVIAGSYLNVPLIAQSIDSNRLELLQTRIESLESVLENQEFNDTEPLTRDQLLGDLFYSGGLGYFSQYIGLSHIVALQLNSNQKLEFGYGSFGYEPNVDSFFGVIRGIRIGGAAFNIRFGNTLESRSGEKQLRNRMRFQTGLISSALEHGVPEQMFSDPQNPTNAVSAIKAIQLAEKAGQKIYQVNLSNVNSVLSNINLDISIENEIREYVSNSRVAIVHTDNISVPGWSGAGYILLDLETGIGSYKISGGGNGGYILMGFIFNFALLALVSLYTGNFIVLGLSMLALIAFGAAFLAYVNAAPNIEAAKQWVGVTLAVVGLMALAPAVIAGTASAVEIAAAIGGLLLAFDSVF